MRGTMVTVNRNGKWLARNTSLLKKVNYHSYGNDLEEDMEEDTDDEEEGPNHIMATPANNKNEEESGSRYPT